jgi:acyl-[acyl-carrier-protein]-phospholipid O-acyltransferase/long-chain-fatty-acid--[acyl-carrier-protein] ligase
VRALTKAVTGLSPRTAGVTLNLVFDGEAARRGTAEPTSVSEGGALAAPLRLKRAPKAVDAEGREVSAPTGLRALVRTHYLGILHDTAFKTFFSAWVTAALTPGEAGLYVSLATGLFTAPYLLFSAWAGRLADRTDKARLINRLKVVEVGLAAGGALALALGSPWGALAVVAALGTRSAVMSPAKYSLLAERVPADKLGGANGWLELSTFLSLVVGTALGGALASWGAGAYASAAFGAAAVVGWWTSRSLVAAAAPGAPAPAPANPGPAPKMPAHLVRTSLAIAFFWLLSSLIQMNIFLYGAQTLGVGTGTVTALLTAIGLATGAGALLAGKLSKDKVELGLVPLGAAGVALALLDLGLFGAGSVVRSFIDLSLLSVAAGFFYIPLNARLQSESPPEARGRFLGLANLMTFAAILASAGVYWLLTTALALTPAGVFTAAAALAVAAAVPTFWFLRTPLRALFAKRLT